MINIPKNDYIQPTEVREWVVQGICEAFLSGSVYHPRQEGYYRHATPMLMKWESGRYSFATEPICEVDDRKTKFNGKEMERAFEELHKAGYFIFRIYKYNSWMGYKCHKKPFLEGGTRVKWFEDFID